MALFNLTNQEKNTLLNLSRKTLSELFHINNSTAASNEIEITPSLSKSCGIFVSIYHQQELRGCIGQFNSALPLYKLLEQVTRSSAINDYRFQPLKMEELKNLTIEISVLTPLERINSIDDLELGKHGIYIKKGFQSGTYLPQVSNKTGWSKAEFVANCSKNKAGLGWEGWRDAELYRYEAIIFGGTFE